MSASATRPGATAGTRPDFLDRGVGLLAPLGHHGEEPKAVVAIYVNDRAARNWDHPEPGTWIDAHNAYFVIGSQKSGSQKSGGMNESEAVPFSSEAAATAFIAESGGRAVRFSDMPQDYVLPHPAATTIAGEHG